MDYFRKNKRMDYFDELTHSSSFQLLTVDEDDGNLICHKQVYKAEKIYRPN